MSTATRQCKLCLIFFLLLATLLCLIQSGNAGEIDPTVDQPYAANGGVHLEKAAKKERRMMSRRMGIGSMAPNCTYNECRGCKYRCRAQQVPVDANDPLNSPYRYKCVCLRS